MILSLLWIQTKLVQARDRSAGSTTFDYHWKSIAIWVGMK